MSTLRRIGHHRRRRPNCHRVAKIIPVVSYAATATITTWAIGRWLSVQSFIGGPDTAEAFATVEAVGILVGVFPATVVIARKWPQSERFSAISIVVGAVLGLSAVLVTLVLCVGFVLLGLVVAYFRLRTAQ